MALLWSIGEWGFGWLFSVTRPKITIQVKE